MKYVIIVIIGLIIFGASQQTKDKTADGIANVVQGVGQGSINSSQILVGYDIKHEPVYGNNGQIIAVDTKTQPVIIKLAVVGALIYGILFYKKEPAKKAS